MADKSLFCLFFQIQNILKDHRQNNTMSVCLLYDIIVVLYSEAAEVTTI